MVANLKNTEKSLWRPMRTAPKDGTLILVCETPNGEAFNVLPACYMQANGDETLTGFWAVAPTRRLPLHLLTPELLNSGDPLIREIPVDWKNIAITPLCWQPLPKPEPPEKLMRRLAQLAGREF